MRGVAVGDPTLDGEHIRIRATDDELHNLQTRFESAAATAEDALEEEHLGKSAVGFRGLLGKNGDEETVFPMPPGYNEDGSKRASLITAGERAVPAGRKTFG